MEATQCRVTHYLVGRTQIRNGKKAGRAGKPGVDLGGFIGLSPYTPTGAMKVKLATIGIDESRKDRAKLTAGIVMADPIARAILDRIPWEDANLSKLSDLSEFANENTDRPVAIVFCGIVNIYSTPVSPARHRPHKMPLAEVIDNGLKVVDCVIVLASDFNLATASESLPRARYS